MLSITLVLETSSFGVRNRESPQYRDLMKMVHFLVVKGHK